MNDDLARSRSDFTSEAGELIDSLALDLSEIERNPKSVAPSVINKIFREAHSLKGLAGMLGFEKIAALAHLLEDVLDGLRMGRIALTSDLIELLGDVLEKFRMLVAGVEPGERATDTEPLAVRIRQFVKSAASSLGSDLLSEVALDDQTRRSLTEYEEHRLLENLQQQRAVFSVRVNFDFSDFDERLKAVTVALNGVGEVVSTLPGVDPSGGSGISFRLLFASEVAEQEIRTLVGDASIEVLRAKPVLTPAGDVFGGAASPAVRVDIDLVDHLISLIGELVIERRRLEELSRELSQRDRRAGLELSRVTRNIDRRLAELQISMVSVRMVPMGQLFSRALRGGRKLARELGKQLEVTIEGGQTVLDKRMVDQLSDPIFHLIRNSVDHGIESPQDRTGKGKNPEGLVALRAFHSGNSVVVEISDDGRGIDLEAVRDTAREMGWIQGGDVSRHALLELLFRPGFSTASRVTDVSGRGVGLDVVRKNIEELRGTIKLETTLGEGTTFRIVLPVTLATMSVLIVRVGSERFAVPLSSIREISRVQPGSVRTSGNRDTLRIREEEVPVLHLGSLVSASPGTFGGKYALLVMDGEHGVAVVVDEVEGQQEILIKSVGERLRGVRGVAGATELSEGEIVVVLDIESLLSQFASESVETA